MNVNPRATGANEIKKTRAGIFYFLGPDGVEPSTKRIQTQFQLSYKFESIKGQLVTWTGVGERPLP
jgi:hypothetical protein